jgi:hypothetical protein
MVFLFLPGKERIMERLELKTSVKKNLHLGWEKGPTKHLGLSLESTEDPEGSQKLTWEPKDEKREMEELGGVERSESESLLDSEPLSPSLK